MEPNKTHSKVDAAECVIELTFDELSQVAGAGGVSHDPISIQKLVDVSSHMLFS